MALYPTADVESALHAAAVKNNVPLSLLRAIAFAESSFDPGASSARAQGLMQLTAATQQTYGVTNPFDAKQSADAAARFLVKLAKPLEWKIDAMLAAYNMGAVGYARAKQAKQPLPKATTDYVRRVLAAQRYYQQQVAPVGASPVLQLDNAVRTLAKLNPQWAPATMALQSWEPYFAKHANDSAPVFSDPDLGGQWANYRAAYARAPITETIDGQQTIGAPLPELVEPDAGKSNLDRLRAAKAMASNALDATAKVLDVAEDAAKVGVFGAIALVVAFLLGASRRR